MAKNYEKFLKVTLAVFRRPVRSYSGDKAGYPETALYDPTYDKTANKSRRATMTYTPDGLVCKQEFGTIIVPLANVQFVRLAD